MAIERVTQPHLQRLGGRCVRRLVKNTRNDKVKDEHRRKYQEFTTTPTWMVSPNRDGDPIIFSITVDPASVGPWAVAGYIKVPMDSTLELVVSDHSATQHHIRAGVWSRFAFVLDSPPLGDVHLRVVAPGAELWGVIAGMPGTPSNIAEPDTVCFSNSSITPECLYFPHESAPQPVPIDARMTTNPDGIQLKLCAYCGRQLPCYRSDQGTLAFHRHSAKRTGHQNECRACKKFRINDSLNIIRTHDQFHESSVISRERALFLREPQLVVRFKRREGEGFRSYLLKKFECRCFKCGQLLTEKTIAVDHTRPVSYLWPLDEHATALCARHNNEKHNLFPVDYYSTEELQRLSRITGLSFERLVEKRVNPRQLAVILADLPHFAGAWSEALFFSVRDKVLKLEDIDLLENLHNEDQCLHDRLVEWQRSNNRT